MTVDLGYTDGDVDTNRTDNPSLNSIIDQRYSRRQTMFGGASAMTMAVLGTTMLAGCDDDENAAPGVNPGGAVTTSSGRAVTLTGSAGDDDGISSATWAQKSGPTATLTQGAVGAASFIAPSVATATDLVFTLTATDGKGKTSSADATVTVMPNTIGFTAVDKNKLDVVSVPAGYTVQVINRTGDPIDAATPAYANDGSDTGASFATRFGDHHDALYWFGLNSSGARDDTASARGLLAQNHENINQQYLHPTGTVVSGTRDENQALKEMYCHGVSIVELSEGTNRQWTHKKDSTFNRRIHPGTAMDFSGPVKGNDLLKTKFSNDGTKGRGTINNCANGHTTWGTLLTCEENWAGYFKRGADTNRTAKEIAGFARYGVTSSSGSYGWSTVTGNDLLARWDTKADGASALADYRNEPHQFGWVVEIDPYDPASTPRKRTALGRFGHEGAWPGKFVAGTKPAFYMGDDSQGEYLYKFVSNTPWVAADANSASRLAIGDKYLDAGTLYVAVFNADGSGTWKPLVYGTAPLDGSNVPYPFASQADILVNPRLAADAVGATPMDRPEWTAVNPVSGEVYLTLTNNANRRGSTDALSGRQFRTDAANPRVYTDPPSATRANRNGHIIRLKEAGDTTEATTFAWDIYLFGADSADSNADVNLSALNATNDFSSPDGLWFGRPTNASGLVKPLLWLQTDDSAFTDRTNNQMLVAMPGPVNDGAVKTITNTNADASTYTQATRVGATATAVSLKRFLVGPVECEITGVDSTPDGRTLFVGIQHPGEGGSPAGTITSHWPDSQTTATPAATVRPRSATVIITKTDGGVVGL